MSSGEGVERTTPFSNSPTALGACVFLATTKAISGNRMPTKTTSPSLISRAAAATMSSLRVKDISLRSPDPAERERDPYSNDAMRVRQKFEQSMNSFHRLTISEVWALYRPKLSRLLTVSNPDNRIAIGIPHASRSGFQKKLLH